MNSLTLIPRLNYDFRISGAVHALLNAGGRSTNPRYFKDLLKTDHIFFTNHARTGLRLLLNATGLPAGSKVGVQAYNCNTVFEAIHMAGYQPVFIDIHEQLTMDPEDLKKKVSHIDLLIVTHTFGIPAQWEEIRSIAGNIPIIEDCAHSFLSSYKGRITGTQGDAAIFSFGNAKFPAVGAGGMVAIHNQKLVEPFIKNYRELPDQKASAFSIFRNWLFTLAHQKFIYRVFSFPVLKKIDRRMDFGGKFKWHEAKLPSFYEKLIFQQSPRFSSYFQKQKAHAKQILDHTSEKIGPDLKPADGDTNYFMIPIQVENRDVIIEQFLNRGIEIGAHFKNALSWAGGFGYKAGMCPVTEAVTKRIITIPAHYRLSNKEVKKITIAVSQILPS